MAGKLGSKLAQLATARKQVAMEAELNPGQRAAIDAEKAAALTAALHNILQPHIAEFNELTEAALHLSLEAKPPILAIKQSRLPLLTVQLTAKAAVFQRKGAYTSDDYFTIHPQLDGSLTFARYSPEVEKPFDANRFAEFLLMEALGLNEPV